MAATARLEIAASRAGTFTLAVCGLQLSITLPLAYILNVWQDDAYTLHTTGGSISNAFWQAITFEQNAPLYFVMMTLWRHIDGSAFFARVFSVLCAALVVLLLPGIIQRYLPELDRRWITVAVAFNSFLIWTALEIRVYALIILLSALLLTIGYDAFLSERPRRSSAVLYAIVTAVALYTQYYMLFLIAGQGTIVLLYRRNRLPSFLASAGAAGLAFLPILWFIPAQMQNFRGDFSAPHSLLASARVLVVILLRYVVAPVGIAHPNIITTVVLAAAIAAGISVRKFFVGSGRIWLPLITVIALLLFSAAVYVAHEHVLNRHVAAMFLPAVLSAFALATMFREPIRSRAVIAWSCVTLLLAVVALMGLYSHLAKPGDWIRVSAYLRAHEKPGQPIAVFEAENALPLEYYYRGPNAIVPIPRGVDFQYYDVSAFIVRNTAQLARVMPHSKQGVWLITAGECSSLNIRFGCHIVERYVAQRYRIVQQAQFYEATVRLLLPN